VNTFDLLLAKSLESVIKKNLGQRTLQKIERRLFEKFGINLTQSLTQFNKLDAVFREFFGAGADGFERKFFTNLISLDKPKNKNQAWITIEDPYLNELILKSYGDEDKKTILNTLMDKKLPILDTLETCKIPQTSGYRKINSLIKDGMLVPEGYNTTHDGKKVTEYTALFENLGINIEKDTILVKVQLRKQIMEKSPIIQILQGL